MLEDLKTRDVRSLDRAIMLAEELNYQRAANRLGITQSALSRSITNLESDFGVNLFKRDKTGVKLTNLGREFVRSAKVLIRQYNAFIREFNGYGQMGPRRASCGITPFTLQTDIVRNAMCTLLAESTDFSLDIDVRGGDQLLQSLLMDEIEFFISADRDVDTSTNRLRLEPLCRSEIAIAVREGHPLLSKDNISNGDLAEYGVLSANWPKRLKSSSDGLDGWREDYQLKTTIYSDDIFFFMKIAAETDSIIVLSKDLLSTGLPYKLVALPADPLISKWKDINIVIVSLENKKMSPLANILIEILRRCATEEDTPT